MKAATIIATAIIAFAVLLSGCTEQDKNPPATAGQYNAPEDVQPPPLPNENASDSSAPPALPDPGQEENPGDFPAPPSP